MLSTRGFSDPQTAILSSLYRPFLTLISRKSKFSQFVDPSSLMENNNKKPLREIECNDLIGKWNNLGGMEVGVVTCALLQPGVSTCKGN